jgi:hypothetical protein
MNIAVKPLLMSIPVTNFLFSVPVIPITHKLPLIILQNVSSILKINDLSIFLDFSLHIFKNKSISLVFIVVAVLVYDAFRVDNFHLYLKSYIHY